MARVLLVLVALMAFALPASAGELPTGHAPAGVRMAHLHEPGEWMIGYHYVYETWDGLMRGSEEISVAEAGYMMVPTSMTMQMHMLHIMYGVTDWLTLALMPQYMTMEMQMAMHMGNGMHMNMNDMDGMSDMGSMNGGMHMHGSHGMSMEVSGWGDTVVAGVFKLGESAHTITLFTLGLSVPTGDVDIKKDGEFVGYGMQLGSGTWDLKPALTYKFNKAGWQLGFQVAATLRLENENESGYQLGNELLFTGWTAYNLTHWSSLSMRLSWKRIGDLDGHYPGLQDPDNATKDPANYGGSIVKGGIGMNFVIPAGMLPTQRLEIEVLAPLYQDYDGVHLDKDYTIHASWSVSF